MGRKKSTKLILIFQMKSSITDLTRSLEVTSSSPGTDCYLFIRKGRQRIFFSINTGEEVNPKTVLRDVQQVSSCVFGPARLLGEPREM